MTNSSATCDNPYWQSYDEYNQNANRLDYISQEALLSDYSSSVSGGGERAIYRVALGYLSDVGSTIGTSV
jgi:hypothetical protein